jgi:cob(I)alamin adenosyltransferase
MVRLNRIYTRTGDDGTTGLVNGERRLKCDKRVACFGSVDETNAAVGVARLHVHAFPDLDVMLIGVQNDLFDLGADLATPEGPEPPEVTPLRVGEAQVARLEREIDFLNRSLEPLRSFVLPGGSSAAAHLHLARTICRRAEREAVDLAAHEAVNPEAIKYLNRLSDFLFVASRWVNDLGRGDVLWVPGKNR